MKTTFLAAALAVALAAGAGADETDAAAWFEKFKALDGEWVQQGEAMKGGKVTYHVTAGGAAVLETLFAGTDHEMMTTYYVEGGELALTHYCHIGNRPHMQAASPEGDTVEFTLSELEGDPNQAHMHSARFTFVGPDHVKVRWTLHEDGQPGHTVELDLARVAKE